MAWEEGTCASLTCIHFDIVFCCTQSRCTPGKAACRPCVDLSNSGARCRCRNQSRGQVASRSLLCEFPENLSSGYLSLISEGALARGFSTKWRLRHSATKLWSPQSCEESESSFRTGREPLAAHCQSRSELPSELCLHRGSGSLYFRLDGML